MTGTDITVTSSSSGSTSDSVMGIREFSSSLWRGCALVDLLVAGEETFSGTSAVLRFREPREPEAVRPLSEAVLEALFFCADERVLRPGSPLLSRDELEGWLVT